MAGFYPMDFLSAGKHICTYAFMSSRKTIVTVSGRGGRSGFYHSTLSHLPARRDSEMETRFDVLGGIMVVGLLAGVVILMHFILAD